MPLPQAAVRPPSEARTATPPLDPYLVEQLELLPTPDGENSDVFDSVCHQGTLNEDTPVAVPFLAGAVLDPSVSPRNRAWLATALGFLAIADNFVLSGYCYYRGPLLEWRETGGDPVSKAPRDVLKETRTAVERAVAALISVPLDDPHVALGVLGALISIASPAASVKLPDADHLSALAPPRFRYDLVRPILAVLFEGEVPPRALLEAVLLADAAPELDLTWLDLGSSRGSAQARELLIEACLPTWS